MSKGILRIKSVSPLRASRYEVTLITYDCNCNIYSLVKVVVNLNAYLIEGHR